MSTYESELEAWKLRQLGRQRDDHDARVMAAAARHDWSVGDTPLVVPVAGDDPLPDYDSPTD